LNDDGMRNLRSAYATQPNLIAFPEGNEIGLGCVRAAQIAHAIIVESPRVYVYRNFLLTVVLRFHRHNVQLLYFVVGDRDASESHTVAVYIDSATGGRAVTEYPVRGVGIAHAE